MGVAKRTLSPEAASDDELNAEADTLLGDPELGRCSRCAALKCEADGDRPCLPHCPFAAAECADCPGAGPCPECWAAECADCHGMLCPDCKLLAAGCRYCGAPLCGGSGCGGSCVSCDLPTCADCSVAVYDQLDTRRRCLHCAVARSGAPGAAPRPPTAREEALGAPAPSTPPRRQGAPRASSTDSWAKTPRATPRRGKVAAAWRPEPAPGPARPTSTPKAVEQEAASAAVGQMRERARGDAKYWAQIQAAHRLLAESTASQLGLAEERRILEVVRLVADLTVFDEAMQREEGARLSAVAMLQVLTTLVSEVEREEAQQRAAMPPKHPLAARAAQATSAASPSTPPRATGFASPGTPPTRATSATAATPTPSTPQRKRRSLKEVELTPPPVAARRKRGKQEPTGLPGKC